MNIALLNDSFPPIIDGVANAVVNYAEILTKKENDIVVLTPGHPDADDSDFSFEVVRYPGIDVRKQIGYIAGYPFSTIAEKALKKHDVDILHSHCPMASNLLARSFSGIIDVPLIMTYHTKYDIDISNLIHSRLIQNSAINAMIDSVNACDEIWAVSKGAAENLHSLGYEGECIIMRNGVDIPKGRLPQNEIEELTKDDRIPPDVPVFLFVGRIMWYKGIGMIIDALAALKSSGYDFRMVFIGKGSDEEEIQAYVKKTGLSENVIFYGAIYDRKGLIAWYCRADLFLFPSTFDTNGLVVREAAACSLPSVLIKGSCAAEDIENNVSGFLVDDDAASLAVCLSSLIEHPEKIASVADKVADKIYTSWDDAVNNAYERYEYVIDRYKSNGYKKHKRPSDEFFRLQGEWIKAMSKVEDTRAGIRKFMGRYM